MQRFHKISGVVMLLTVALLLLVLVRVTNSGINKSEEHAVKIDTGWDVSINDNVYEDVILSEFMFPLVDKGDIVTLTGILPEDEMQFPVLEFYSIHSAIRVTVDGQEIYAYGQELYEKGKILGYGYQYIDLPEDYAGKSIKITLQISEDNAFSSFVIPRICNAKWVIRDFIFVNRIPMVINLFLIIFGICVAGVTIICMIKRKEIYPLLCIALFSFGIGLWSFCSYNLSLLFFDDMRVKVYCEFAALYLTPVPMFFYFYRDAMRFDSKLRKRAYFLLLGLLLIFEVVAFGGQATNLIHFPALLKMNHILLALLIVYLIYMFIGDIIRHQLDNAALFLGVILMIGFVAYDLVRFNFEKFVKISGGKAYEGLSCIGTLLFIVALLMDFGERIARNMYDAAANATLEKMAYTDALTNLANRRSCEAMFDELDETPSNYAIIDFDLNNLKQVNDRLGHEEGDVYIREFGAILKQVFEKYGLVGRTGGDEFLVIVKDSSNLDIAALIRDMNDAIHKKNEEHPGWNMSVAYGVSIYAEDYAESVRYAYKKADERMYHKKRAMKLAKAQQENI